MAGVRLFFFYLHCFKCSGSLRPLSGRVNYFTQLFAFDFPLYCYPKTNIQGLEVTVNTSTTFIKAPCFLFLTVYF